MALDDMGEPIVASPQPQDDNPQMSPGDALDSSGQATADSLIVQEAQRRFDFTSEWERDFATRFKEDFRFANGDSDNHYQWPDQIYQDRTSTFKPALTINKTRQHNLQIINDSKKNKPSITAKPTGGGASFESSQMIVALMRHIESQSLAANVYDKATEFQVNGGVGYWRVVTDYVDDESVEQDFFIRLINDPLSVRIDPEARMPDKSDMRYAFIFEDLSYEKFHDRYPDYRGALSSTTLSTSSLGTQWMGKDLVRQAEYFRKVRIPGKIYSNGEKTFTDKDLAQAPHIARQLMAAGFKERRIWRTNVEWYHIVGNTIVDRNIWPGKYIPVVQLVGEEYIIDGMMDRRGHTRMLKDPQRMYNYWSSTAVEFGALQSKTPWVAPAKAIENYTNVWNTANTRNHSVLPYNHIGEDGQPIPPPVRTDPPVSAPAALDGMKIASMEFQLASGQYEAQMGQQGNERTGRAIAERQRQGDTATYHYLDQQAISITYTGKIILDAMPNVYDTKRVMMLTDEAGDPFELLVDPNAQKAYAMQQQVQAQTAQKILNPNKGKYEITATVGPNYATRREEAFNAFTLLLTQAPALTQLLGDIMFRAGDFPGADEAARRLKRMVPPQALGIGPSPQEVQLQNQLNALQGAMQDLMTELGQTQMKAARAENKSRTDAYNAITQRLKVLIDSSMDAQQLKIAVAKMMMDLLGQTVDVEDEDDAQQSAPAAGGAAGAGIADDDDGGSGGSAAGGAAPAAAAGSGDDTGDSGGE